MHSGTSSLFGGNSRARRCQRAALAALLLAACSGGPSAPPAPAPQSAAAAPASVPASAPQSAPAASLPAKDACTSAPMQASMLVVKEDGFPGEVPPPKGKVAVVSEKPAGPGARALVIGNGKKNLALRYSLPGGKTLPVKTGQEITVSRARGMCALGTIDGWSVSDERGLLAKLDAGGCAPAWPEEVIPGLTLAPEDKQCAPRRPGAKERPCALKVTWPGGARTLAPGEEQAVELADGKFLVVAGLCAMVEEGQKTGGGKRRANAPYRMSYAITRAD